MSTQRTYSDPSLQDKIRSRAYQLFEQRGYEHGRDFDDWLQAEAEVLRSKISVTPIRPTPKRNNNRAKRANT